MKIHIYHHTVEDESCIKNQLDRIESKLDELLSNNTDVIPQEVIDKLDAIIEDVKQTIS